MGTEISLLAAFIAGIFSVTSPCVLPLIPIYLAHLAGVSIGDQGFASRARVVGNAGAYVLGFSLVFILLGASIGTLSGLVTDGDLWLVRIGGVLLVVMGLHLLGLIRLPMLDQTRQLSISPKAGSFGRLATSFGIGAAFGAGWTPCVGPILGAILTMAATTGAPGEAAFLLAVYSAGFAIPFLAAAFAFGSSASIIRSLTKRLGLINSVSGGVILAVGIVLLLGIYGDLFAYLAESAPWRPWEPGV
jgi:cytochrome c-type biogenesis protein